MIKTQTHVNQNLESVFIETTTKAGHSARENPPKYNCSSSTPRIILQQEPTIMENGESTKKPSPGLEYAFTLHVDLLPPVSYGTFDEGDKRFIPISGGKVDGPKLQGTILPGGGDWNTVHRNGVVDVWARYSIMASDGTIIGITNAGRGRSSQSVMEGVFENGIDQGSDGSSGWYTKTFPQFEVAPGSYEWLAKTCFMGDLLLPTEKGHVKIDVFEVL
jgi:hypothetical protein